MKNKTKSSIFSLLILITLVTSLIFSGEILDWREVLSIGSLDNQIFVHLRLPRIITCFMLGGALALLGSVYQTLFSNPLADSYSLGISSVATLVLVFFEVFLGVSSTSYWAITGATLLAGFTALLLLAPGRGILGSEGLTKTILFGMGINFVASSLVFVLISYQNQQVGGTSLKWIFGNIPWNGWGELAFLSLATLFLLILTLYYANKLDVLSLGDSVARTLGVEPKHTRNILLIFSSFYLAFSVSLVGVVGFVGLTVPHMVRKLFLISRHRDLLVLSFVIGGFFLVLADAVSRSIYPPLEFPIGVITAILGGPLFLWLIWRR